MENNHFFYLMSFKRREQLYALHWKERLYFLNIMTKFLSCTVFLKEQFKKDTSPKNQNNTKNENFHFSEIILRKQ